MITTVQDSYQKTSKWTLYEIVHRIIMWQMKVSTRVYEKVCIQINLYAPQKIIYCAQKDQKVCL
jgi:hypothetical protein